MTTQPLWSLRAKLVAATIACLVVGLLAIASQGHHGAYQRTGYRTSTTTDDAARISLCHDQERLLAHYVTTGDTAKMRQYQGYLTANRCYGG